MDKTNTPFWNDVIKAYEQVEENNDLSISVQRDGLRAEIRHTASGVRIFVWHDSESKGVALVTKTVDPAQVDDSEDKRDPNG